MADNPRKPDSRTEAAARAAIALTRQRPRPPSPEWIADELARCKDGVEGLICFVNTYIKIYDNASKSWIAFTLWPAQENVLREVYAHKFTVNLKARQEGLSWLLGDAFPLWQMIFAPIAEVLMFSQRDDEAIGLLNRLKGSYERLPDWIKIGVDTNAAHEFKLFNGSRAQALPASTGGRSNAATYVFIDEADFVTDLAGLINFAKPTIDPGDNKMVVNSTVNKATPNSYFQQLYKAARDEETEWKAIFLPWWAHPGRTQIWYDKEKLRIMVMFGTLDSLYEQYPATDTEALSSRLLDKRYHPDLIAKLYQQTKPLDPLTLLDVPLHTGLRIYKVPEQGHTYGIGADPAGGNPNGDDSAACVVDALTWEQVATLAGKIEPTQFANQIADLSEFYSKAPVLVELNNHGHAVLAQLKHRGTSLRMVTQTEGARTTKPYWLTTGRSKHYLFDIGEKVMQAVIMDAMARNEPPSPILFDPVTSSQVANIDVNELAAPEGDHDDYAMAWVLSQMCVYRGIPSMQQLPHTGLWPSSNGGASAGKSETPGLDKLAQLQRAAAMSKPPALPPDAGDDGAEPDDEEPLYIKLLRDKGR